MSVTGMRILCPAAAVNEVVPQDHAINAPIRFIE
jgi:hypothetical protein